MMQEYENIFVLVDSSDKDRRTSAEAIGAIAEESSSKLVVFSNGEEALNFILQNNNVSIVITEYRLEGVGGIEIVKHLQSHKPHLPCILFTSSNDADLAIKAIQAGATDYLPKPSSPAELKEIILEVTSESTDSNHAYKPPQQINTTPDQLIGNSRAMALLYRDLGKVAATPVTVLILGETGTGKELVAKALHRHGHRAHLPMVAVNCAAIPDTLLESELFGHERGAFTGANQRKIGRFEQAKGGTIFLDEIGDMQPLLQAKMLRVLQEKSIQRIGGAEEIPVDVRIIAATHQNLGKMVEEGSFRQDLYFRLNGATIRIPPLRSRLGDIKLLSDYFLQLYTSELSIKGAVITPEAYSFLSRQLWPGNVRQLQNVIRQAILKKRERPIRPDDLSPLIHEKEAREIESIEQLVLNYIDKAEKNTLPEGAYRALIKHTESVLINEVLQVSKGNQSKAAKLLGITRYTLREKIKSLGLGVTQG